MITLRRRLARPEILVVPGAYDSLTARFVEVAGFEAVYLSGAGVSYSKLARPDIGLVNQTEMAERLGDITRAVSIPVMADGDNGHGNAINMMRTIELFERAGAQAVQIEDQRFPKRCGHLDGKSIISSSEMIGKIRAARRARSSDDLLIIARTDARSVHGLEDAIVRARAYAEAGADALFIEAPTSKAELQQVAEALPGMALMANMVEGGKTPVLPAAELQAMGYSMVIYPNTLIRRFVTAAREVLGDLSARGTTAEPSYSLATLSEIGELLGMAEISALEDHLIPAPPAPPTSEAGDQALASDKPTSTGVRRR